MNINEKLYRRLPNGRYEEYHEPYHEDSKNILYRKVGKKYVPWEIRLSSDFVWQEGVFAVTRSQHAIKPNCWTNAEYLQTEFKVYKCGEIEKVSIGYLAGMDKLSEYLALHWNEISGHNSHEKAASIVAILMRGEEEMNNQQTK